MQRIWNMGTHQRARKNDTIDATQNAPSHHTNEKKYKKIVKHKVKTCEDLDNIDSSCTDDESENGQSSVSHNDQDSDVSFESDNDEEIDANCHITEREIVDESCGLEPRTQLKKTGPTERLGGQEKMGR